SDDDDVVDQLVRAAMWCLHDPRRMRGPMAPLLDRALSSNPWMTPLPEVPTTRSTFAADPGTSGAGEPVDITQILRWTEPPGSNASPDLVQVTGRVAEIRVH